LYSPILELTDPSRLYDVPSRGTKTQGLFTTPSHPSPQPQYSHPRRYTLSAPRQPAQVLTSYSAQQVIKALYSYKPDPNNAQELGFEKGDFFHVISRENDPNWYEACNPLIPSARGLVPVTYFEIIAKTERQSAGSAASGASNVIPSHDSGYSENTSHTRQDSTTRKQGRTRMSSMGKGSGAMVYGIVQYDFNAERPDELEAKEGEAIIVIAQSNPEWFVAKPIGRLGGPGLIPVSFIEIRDMTTGEAVPDAQGAVTRAGVPKVEEWKKMAADYKNSSITLGKFEQANAASMQKDLERMSVNNGSQPHNGTNGGTNSSPYVCIWMTFYARQTLIAPTAISRSSKAGFEEYAKWLRSTISALTGGTNRSINSPIHLRERQILVYH